MLVCLIQNCSVCVGWKDVEMAIRQSNMVFPTLFGNFFQTPSLHVFFFKMIFLKLVSVVVVVVVFFFGGGGF